MKQLIIIFLFCLNGTFLYSQDEVTGQVKDAKTKNDLEFCSVTVLNKKDSALNKCLTNNKGYFSIPLSNGKYRFLISFVGYKPDTTELTDITEDIFLGVIKLNPDEKYLKTFTVTANSRENLLDRDEQVVTDQMREGAADAKDVLGKINGVEYDGSSNTIYVDNNPKVLILVDGMEKDQDYIKNLAPERLKKVEVIRNPGGRYGLEGYTAVINILLKKDYQGTEIYINDITTENLEAPNQQYIEEQNSATGTVNYTYNKLNIYVKYNNYYFNQVSTTTDDKEYSNGMFIKEGPLQGNNNNTFIKEPMLKKPYSLNGGTAQSSCHLYLASRKDLS